MSTQHPSTQLKTQPGRRYPGSHSPRCGRPSQQGQGQRGEENRVGVDSAQLPVGRTTGTGDGAIGTGCGAIGTGWDRATGTGGRTTGTGWDRVTGTGGRATGMGGKTTQTGWDRAMETGGGAMQTGWDRATGTGGRATQTGWDRATGTGPRENADNTQRGHSKEEKPQTPWAAGAPRWETPVILWWGGWGPQGGLGCESFCPGCSDRSSARTSPSFVHLLGDTVTACGPPISPAQTDSEGQAIGEEFCLNPGSTCGALGTPACSTVPVLGSGLPGSCFRH